MAVPVYHNNPAQDQPQTPAPVRDFLQASLMLNYSGRKTYTCVQ
uniref:Uncharacterized protein n=1 Tax=Physcomitrium patens TaxID=3218 RepID=A0A7I4BXS0_PHYPA